jgi:F-type H+-transporting ATPase subunit b
MKKNSLLLVTAILAQAASAAGGAGGDHGHAIPWTTIGWQAFNVILLFGVLTYFMKKAVVAHFKGRQSTYLEMVNKAESARQEAERNRTDLNNKLNELERSTQASLSKARAEAEALRQKIVLEADEMSKRLKSETDKAIHLEMEKAKEQLRLEILAEATEAAREKLKSNMNGPEQKRLQSEFVDKIQAVPR